MDEDEEEKESFPTESVFLTSPSNKKSSDGYKSGSIDTKVTKPPCDWTINGVNANMSSPRLIIQNEHDSQLDDFKSS